MPNPVISVQDSISGRSSALQGTNGAAHSVDGALLFRKEDTGTYTYLGDATPGTATSTAKWRIARVTNADSTILYANAGAFTATWDNRATETYS